MVAEIKDTSHTKAIRQVHAGGRKRVVRFDSKLYDVYDVAAPGALGRAIAP
jgi:hypothetical protein